MEKLASKNLGATERKALTSLHEDLQPGQGAWTISFGSLKQGDIGATQVNFNVNNGSDASAGGTTIDMVQFSKQDANDKMAAIATEGGIYGTASGRAGPAEQKAMGIAAWRDFWQFHGRDDVHSDEVTNALYNRPLGLPEDE